MWDDAYQNCQLCPRNCQTNRQLGKLGICGESSTCRIASTCQHFGEEPSFSGKKGSGTIFFTGCSCHCFFCQNYQISQQHQGTTTTIEQLYQKATELIKTGVHNLNFVTPTHFLPHILELCKLLRQNNYNLPLLYNSSGYETSTTIKLAAQYFDIFLPDFKFADPKLAKHCINDAQYPKYALQTIKTMIEQKGFLQPWDETGTITASKGVLVRHLVLPGQLQNSIDVIKILHNNFGKHLPISIMSQFTPTPNCLKKNSLNRKITQTEYQTICQLIEQLKFQKAYIQLDFGDDDFLPNFTKESPFKGNPD